MRGSLWIVPDLWKTAHNAFPTRSLDAQNASTRSTGVLLCGVMKKNKNESRKMMMRLTSLRRIARPTAVVAPLR
jgi:hypothetical protein